MAGGGGSDPRSGDRGGLGSGTKGAAMGGTPDEEEADGLDLGTLRGPDAAALRRLRALVTTLTAVMILGIITIVALLVIRLPEMGRTGGGALASAPLPEALVLPDGARATAFTRGPGWFAVVTDDDRILIYDADGRPRQEIRVERAEGR